MAKFIGSKDKTEYLCYTFHERVKQKYKTFDDIVKKLKELYNVKEEDIIAEIEKRINRTNKAFEWVF